MSALATADPVAVDHVHLVASPLDWPSATGGLGTPEERYGRLCWLPILGPSTWALWTVCAELLDPERAATNHPLTVDHEALASAIGLGRTDRLTRTFDRLERFHLARHDGDVASIPTVCPPVRPHHVAEIPGPARRYHHDRIDALDPADRTVLDALFADTVRHHDEYRSTP